MNRFRTTFKAVMAALVIGIPLAVAQPAENPPEEAGKRPPRVGGGYPMRRYWETFRQTLDKLRQENPAEYERLEKLKATDREAYFEEVRKLVPRQPWFPNKVAKMDRACYELSRQYRQARTEAEKDAIRKEIEKAVEAATDAMIADLKSRLETMTKRLAEMETKRAEMIEKRIDMLLKMPDPKGPGPDGRGGMMPPPPPPPAQ